LKSACTPMYLVKRGGEEIVSLILDTLSFHETVIFNYQRKKAIPFSMAMGAVPQWVYSSGPYPIGINSFKTDS